MSETIKTFYRLDFVNFNYNDGDYFICKYIEDIVKILYDIEPILDTDTTIEFERPYSVTISPIFMTQSDYDKWIKETWMAHD